MADGSTYRIDIDGMSCAGCAGRAERALAYVPGVQDASVNFATKTAQVQSGTASARDLSAALKAAGYPAREATAKLSVDGMTCATCVGRAEAALAAVPGVIEASVNLAAQSAHVRYLDGMTDPAALARQLSDAGYPAEAAQDDQPSDRSAKAADEIHAARRMTLIAGALTLPVFLLEMGGHVIPALHVLIDDTIGMTTSWMVQFVLTTLVLVWPGRVFYARGLPALFRGEPDMNSLVALGTLAAWGFSSVALFAPDLLPQSARAVYYEAAAVIVTLILLGRWLEARARGRTGAAIQTLLGLQPDTTRLERDGKVVEVSIDDVRVGDTLHVRPGERLAVDGTVLTGTSYVDEAMITGEPTPVAKAAGDAVTGGTINGQGALTYRAAAVGRDTVLARIVAMVEDAQGAKLPIQALADRVVGVFVPVVIAIAVLTIIAWLFFGPSPAITHALVAGVSVLIIACPCAMGLATPTSIMVGTGRAAELGVLFRKGDALQRLDGARLLAFDKTGTLTQGQPDVIRVELAEGMARDHVLRLTAAAEHQSEHPLARAIERAAEGLDLPQASDVQSHTGRGLSASVDGHGMLIGTARLMGENDIDTTAMDNMAEDMADKGQTPVYVAIDGALAALIGIADPVKPSSKAAISALHAAGIATAMITGDTERTARAIAADLGITHVIAGVLPDGKLDAIRELRAAHGVVGFVGDGINDAPALAEADIGIAVGSGTDVAIEAADIVLMSGDLMGVVTARDLSARTMANIRQNLFWAFGYNTALIPVAAGVLYPLTGMLLSPMLAAGAMALSSVFVLSNALRLRRAGGRG